MLEMYTMSYTSLYENDNRSTNVINVSKYDILPTYFKQCQIFTWIEVGWHAILKCKRAKNVKEQMRQWRNRYPPLPH